MKAKDQISVKSHFYEERKAYCNGWHTWNNDSVMSYICPMDGRGIRLCVKDYKNAAFLENALIGEEYADVVPIAHAYDDSFTNLKISWKEIKLKLVFSVQRLK